MKEELRGVVKGMVVKVRAQDKMIPWYTDWWDWLGGEELAWPGMCGWAPVGGMPWGLGWGLQKELVRLVLI